MIDVYLGLGSNMGNKRANIQQAIQLLGAYGAVIAVSSLHETEPWGYANQDRFLNCAVLFQTSLSPQELLQKILNIEQRLKRVRTIPNGPRTIDIDILLYGKEIIRDPELTVPHPRMHLRSFVLDPLVEIAPDVVHPVLKRPIQELQREQRDT